MSNYDVELWKTISSPLVGRALVFLLEFTHSSLSEPVRLVNNAAEVVSEGDTFTPYNFSYKGISQGQIAEGDLILDNINGFVTDVINKALDVAPNENINVQIWLINLEDNGVVSNRINQGTFKIDVGKIDKLVTPLKLSLNLSLPYNIGTIRQTKENFPNIFL